MRNNNSTLSVTQPSSTLCGNFRIFLLLRFCVKSIFLGEFSPSPQIAKNHNSNHKHCLMMVILRLYSLKTVSRKILDTKIVLNFHTVKHTTCKACRMHVCGWCAVVFTSAALHECDVTRVQRYTSVALLFDQYSNSAQLLLP